MYEFWCDYVKQKYGGKANFIVYIKTDDIYKDSAKVLETRFDTSNCELNRPLHKRKCKKVIELMKDQ